MKVLESEHEVLNYSLDEIVRLGIGVAGGALEKLFSDHRQVEDLEIEMGRSVSDAEERADDLEDERAALEDRLYDLQQAAELTETHAMIPLKDWDEAFP